MIKAGQIAIEIMTLYYITNPWLSLVTCVFRLFRPRKGVHHPSVIAHGGAFFWLRSFRQRDLEVPPVAWLG